MLQDKLVAGVNKVNQHKIQINLKIRVNRKGEKNWYASSVQDIDRNSFSISIPTLGASPLILKPGEQVNIAFVLEMSRFEFETKVIGRRYDNIPLYVMALPKRYVRVQLREFVRIPVILEVKYAVLPDDGKQPTFNICSSLDLSGGGMKLLLEEKYPESDKLILRFTLPFKTCAEEIEAVGRVVRVWRETESTLYQTAVKFERISRKQQDLIVRFILMKMSEQRRLR